MADGVGGDGFWLPAEFFDDFVTDKENLDKNWKTSDSCFPAEFPYEAVPASTAAAPHLGKRWVTSTSPQSTLARGRSWSSNGSPSGVYSPPPSPLGEFDAVGDLIHRAAGQVVKLRLSDAVAHANYSGFMVAQRNSNQTAFQNIHLQQQHNIMKQQKPESRVWYAEPQMHQIRATGRPMAGHQEAWSIRPIPARNSASASSVLYGAAGATKRGRTGTGVFLPRQYGLASDSRKINAASACAPDRNVNGQLLNKSLSNMNGFLQYQPQPHPKSKAGFLYDYELLVAQRNAALMLQRRQSLILEHSSSPVVARGVCLPQEWAY